MADPSLVQHVRRPNTIEKRPVCMVYGVCVCARVCVCVCVFTSDGWREGGRRCRHGTDGEKRERERERVGG